MKQYNYTSKEYPARLRSQRSQDIAATGNSGGLSIIPANPDPVPGVTDHSELSGIVSTANETYSDFARDIHLAAPDADALKRLRTLEVIKTEDPTIETDENVYSAARAKWEHEKKTEADEKKFIRKDKPDETEHRVDFKDGLTVGEYVGGFTGDGTILDKDGHIEASSLTLREFLEVPELRFNRIDVVSGELWNSIAFGLIESVDETNQIVTLHLEEGELSGLHVNDFCRGIFHNLTDNETAPGTDSSGFDVMVGFRTSYFTPVEIIDNKTFRYELKPGSIVHPCKVMKFAVYGNPTDKNRQSSAYHTRTYTRYLRDVSTWKIEEKHISMQLGDLSNLIINGERLEEGSVYLNNVYFGGNVWYTGKQEEDIKGKDAYSVTLSTYSAVYNKKDGIYNQADVVTADKMVLSGSDQVIASDFKISSRLQVSKGPEPLRFSEVIGAGKYVVSSVGSGCSYVITDGLVAVREVTEDKAEIKIEVNCEGLAVYEVVFTIVRVMDGADGKDVEFIFRRTTTNAKPSIPATSQTDDYIPEGWTDDPVGPTISIPYEWVCKRIKKDEIWGDYSTPSLWVKYGFDGQPGSNGTDGTSEYTVYRRSASQPATPSGNSTSPSGWALDPPSGATPLWASKAIFYSNGSLARNWSTPVKITGDPGTAGIQGSIGSIGPAITNRGKYSSVKQYYGGIDRVDVVYDGTYYYMAKTTASIFQGQPPAIDNKYWKRLEGQFESIATGMAVIGEANIAGWRFKELYIESQNNNVVLDGNANDGPRIALGASYANRANAPLRMYEDGKAVIKKGEIAGFTIENGWLKANATTLKDVGYIDMRSSNTRISFGNNVGAPYSTTKCTAIIENTQPNKGGGTGLFADENIALRLRSWSAGENTALDCVGGLRWIGRTMNVNQPIVIGGNAIRDVIEVKIRYCNEYVFGPSGDAAVDLPSASMISSAFGSYTLPAGGNTEDSSLIQINIMLTRWATGRVLLRGVSGAPLINCDGNQMTENTLYSYGNIYLGKGDQICVVYMNRSWYIRYLSR